MNAKKKVNVYILWTNQSFTNSQGFLDGSVVKNLLVSAGNTGSIPGQEWFHVLQSN